jgi:hypothetical protein
MLYEYSQSKSPIYAVNAVATTILLAIILENA